MTTGTVKWFNAKKGFGFIQPADGGADLFFHISAVEAAGRKLAREGEHVAYTLFTSGEKTFARNLIFLDDDA